MNSRFLAQHFTVNISKFQLPRKGVKSQLSRSSCMYKGKVIENFNAKIVLPFSPWFVRRRFYRKGFSQIQLLKVAG